MHAPLPPTPPKSEPSDGGRFIYRGFEPQDQQAVLRLYEIGMLAGEIAPNDTGADVDHIAAAYLEDERHHFWVALDENQVVGMIGVASDDHDTAEIRRLRVRPDLQHTGIAAELLQLALNHCRKHGYLKVRLDTRFERCEALETFERVGFRHTRDRSAPGKEILEFYADLYRNLDEEPTGQAPAATATASRAAPPVIQPSKARKLNRTG
ncbi:MAG: GNAT family N-acetyltransferase [Planctomycetota bacterium]